MFLDSYMDAGVLVAVELANRLIVRPDSREPEFVLAHVLDVDPPSVAQLRDTHVPEFRTLARELKEAFADLASGDEDAAADRLNRMLASSPAHPHLAKEDGQWRLHHHPADAALVQMWSSICAEALARLLAGGHADRVGACADPGCRQIFIDTSRNGSRRYCSTTCQNRIKTAALRRRRAMR